MALDVYEKHLNIFLLNSKAPWIPISNSMPSREYTDNAYMYASINGVRDICLSENISLRLVT